MSVTKLTCGILICEKSISIWSSIKSRTFGLQHRNELQCQGPIWFGITDEDICHQVESAGVGIITRNYTPRKFITNSDCASPTTNRGRRLTTIELEVGDGQVPH